MKKIALILVSVSCALTAHAITIFDDFNSGNTYDLTNAWNLGGGNVGAGFTDVAAQFVAGGTGFLSTVDLGVTYISQSPVSAYLYADAAGMPDNLNQIFLGSGTPTGQFNTTNNYVLSLSVSNVAPVTVGTTYWLVLKIADPVNGFDQWNWNTTGAVGAVDLTFDDSNWIQVSPTITLPAFRLLASELPPTPTQPGNGVPESGGTLAMLVGTMATLFGFRRLTAEV